MGVEVKPHLSCGSSSQQQTLSMLGDRPRDLSSDNSTRGPADTKRDAEASERPNRKSGLRDDGQPQQLAASHSERSPDQLPPPVPISQLAYPLVAKSYSSSTDLMGAGLAGTPLCAIQDVVASPKAPSRNMSFHKFSPGNTTSSASTFALYSSSSSSSRMNHHHHHLVSPCSPPSSRFTSSFDSQPDSVAALRRVCSKDMSNRIRAEQRKNSAIKSFVDKCLSPKSEKPNPMDISTSVGNNMMSSAIRSPTSAASSPTEVGNSSPNSSSDEGYLSIHNIKRKIKPDSAAINGGNLLSADSSTSNNNNMRGDESLTLPPPLVLSSSIKEEDFGSQANANGAAANMKENSTPIIAAAPPPSSVVSMRQPASRRPAAEPTTTVVSGPVVSPLTPRTLNDNDLPEQIRLSRLIACSLENYLEEVRHGNPPSDDHVLRNLMANNAHAMPKISSIPSATPSPVQLTQQQENLEVPALDLRVQEQRQQIQGQEYQHRRKDSEEQHPTQEPQQRHDRRRRRLFPPSDDDECPYPSNTVDLRSARSDEGSYPRAMVNPLFPDYIGTYLVNIYKALNVRSQDSPHQTMLKQVVNACAYFDACATLMRLPHSYAVDRSLDVYHIVRPFRSGLGPQCLRHELEYPEESGVHLECDGSSLQIFLRWMYLGMCCNPYAPHITIDKSQYDRLETKTIIFTGEWVSFTVLRRLVHKYIKTKFPESAAKLKTGNIPSDVLEAVPANKRSSQAYKSLGLLCRIYYLDMAKEKPKRKSWVDSLLKHWPETDISVLPRILDIVLVAPNVSAKTMLEAFDDFTKRYDEVKRELRLLGDDEVCPQDRIPASFLIKR